MDSPRARNPLGLSSTPSVSTDHLMLPSNHHYPAPQPLARTLSAATRLSDHAGGSTGSSCHLYGMLQYARHSDSSSELTSVCSGVGVGGCSSSSSACSSRNITLAKEILAEACTCFGGCDSPRSARAPSSSASSSSLLHPSDSSRRMSHEGALSPLLALLHETLDPDKACSCLGTMCFLLLDQANRNDLYRLGGLHVLLDVLQQYDGDVAVQVPALQAIAGLVAGNDEAKAALWRHPQSGAVLGLLSTRHAPALALELLALAPRLAFVPCRANPSDLPSHTHPMARPALRLLEPRLLSAACSLLHPLAPPSVLRASLGFLRATVEAEPIEAPTDEAAPDGGDRSSAWHATVFMLAPLLQQAGGRARGCSPLAPPQPPVSPMRSTRTSCSSSSSCAAAEAEAAAAAAATLEAALQLLLALTDRHPRLRNTALAAGCVSPLLPLLSHGYAEVRISAACVLASVADHEPSRLQLSHEAPLRAMVQLLRRPPCVEVTVGLLYVLGRLTARSPGAVAPFLAHLGAVPLLHKLARKRPGFAATVAEPDHDVALGAAQLLHLLGDEAAAAGAGAGAGASAALGSLPLGCAAMLPTAVGGPPIGQKAQRRRSLHAPPVAAVRAA